MIRAGLVGLGEIGQVHLAALRETPEVKLAAVCDRDPLLVASSVAGECPFEDFGEMLAAEELDVVDLCLPHSLHAPLAIEALAAGTHVLLEKPMAVSVDECDRIIGAARSAGRRVAVSHNQLFYGPHVAVREMLDAGELGRLRAVRTKLAIGGKYGGWRADPAAAGGGLAIDAGAHRFYVIEMLGGPARSLTATMDRVGSEEAFGVVLELEGGAIATIDACYHAPEGVFDDRIEVIGSSGLAEVTGVEALFEGFASGAGLRVWRGGAWEERDHQDDWTASVKASVHATCRALASGGEPPVGGAAGRRLVSMIQGAYRSARTGERVAL